jgi:hypothetical protein
MSDVIDFMAKRAEREPPLCCYVNISRAADWRPGLWIDDGMSPDDMRKASEFLFEAARQLRDAAWAETKDDDDRQIAVIRIYSSSRVNTWTSNDCSTPDQLEWLDRRLSEASEAAKKSKP